MRSDSVLVGGAAECLFLLPLPLPPLLWTGIGITTETTCLGIRTGEAASISLAFPFDAAVERANFFVAGNSLHWSSLSSSSSSSVVSTFLPFPFETNVRVGFFDKTTTSSSGSSLGGGGGEVGFVLTLV